ncbi:hypothetical protein AG1IA_01848 [Rhizoctonia solani AG-1 IA]|uniref:Uncharacterized protein n=1 Tax=Thanatephorus cucumeris (strain AG1-IA) TaxID=983506 RepID=L8X1B1_THACA|nr:hypothetical protein AG1IA_01848 [Rhizoctonia solani AG-1 IA]
MMTSHASRPAPLQTLTIPTIVIHYAEPTSGLTPRTPYSQDCTDAISESPIDDIHIKVHLSPSAPITPIQSRMPREKSVARPPIRLQRKTQPSRGRRVLMWSVILVLLAITSFLLRHISGNPRHSPTSELSNRKPMEWITVKHQKMPVTLAPYPTPGPAVLDSIEVDESGQTIQHWGQVV